MFPAGGPDENGRIAALEGQASGLREQAERLKHRCTPRPTPSQYLALQEEVVRFAGGLCAVPRVVEMVSGLSAGGAAAAGQATVWQQNAGAWAGRMGRQYSQYRDIVQPVQLAVQELRYGLSLMAGAVTLGAGPSTTTMASVVVQLMAYPRLSGAAQLSAVALDAPAVQAAVAAAATSAVAERQPASTSPEQAEGQKAALYAAGIAARLRLLRIALHDGVRDARAARAGGDDGALASALQRLHAIFQGEDQGQQQLPSFSASLRTLQTSHIAGPSTECLLCPAAAFVGAWEEIKAEEARRAAEEAELFKSKLRSTAIETDAQEEEREYQAAFPDQFGAFADLAEGFEEGGDGMLVDDAPPASTPAPPPQHSAASAKDLVMGEVLHDLLAAHREAFGDAAELRALAAAGPAPDGSSVRQFLFSYELGTDLLRGVGLTLPASVDAATREGHLMAICAQSSQLNQPPVQGEG